VPGSSSPPAQILSILCTFPALAVPEAAALDLCLFGQEEFAGSSLVKVSYHAKCTGSQSPCPDSQVFEAPPSEAGQSTTRCTRS
jgi:hypothetical protein